MKQLKAKRTSMLVRLFLFMYFANISFSYAQHNQLYVEGEGEHISVFHSILDPAGGTGDVGLDLLRGDRDAHTDWRILNEGGHFRLQSGLDNFFTDGTNRISVLETGETGIGCTNPQAKLTICSGEQAFSNAFSESAADKISLDGYRFDQPDMVGLGYETSTYVDASGPILEVSDLYFKAEGAHRWYSNRNADLGISAAMVLNREGNLGIDVRNPLSRLHIENGRDASLSSNGYVMLGNENSFNLVMDTDEIQARISGDNADLSLQRSGGLVGIGTGSPDVKLQVEGGSDVSDTAGGFLQLGNSSEIHVAIDNNEIQARKGNQASDLYLQADAGNVLLCIQEQGQVGIGITSSDFLPDPAYLLAVDGKILSEEVRVEMSGAWPDYVFDESYDLLPLEKLKASIEEHGHLPGIPSAAKVEKDGILLGDMQTRTMEKIEELTLYMIQLNEENQALRTEVEDLKKQIK